MRTLSTIGCFLLAASVAVLPPGAGADEPADYDARLRAAFIGLERPKDSEEVVRLLDKGANPNARDEFGRTAVHYAAGGTTEIAGTGALLNLLLLKGGDCCLQDSQGDTPLHYAVAKGTHGLPDDSDIQHRIRSLLGHGANPDVPNRRGYTALHFSAKSDVFVGLSLVNILLQAGADPNRSADDGSTSLHLAAGVPVILDHGHGHDIFSQGRLTGRSITTFDDDALIIRALLAGGAKPNVTNNAGMTPLLVALSLVEEPLSHIIAATNALLSAGADPNFTRRDGLSPLHIVLNYPESRSRLARRMTQESIVLVEALLGAGADPDTKNPKGDTPLHVAVRQWWGEDMVDALLAGGADPCIRNDDEQWLPEQLARRLGQKDVNLALQLGGGYEDTCEKREEEKLGLDRDARRRVQSCLKTAGFDPGAPDGLFGPRTRGAVQEWQEARGNGEATGYLTQAELDDLLASCKSAAPTPLCTGETDTPCWMETINQPGCHMWNPYPAPEETVTWSGACVDGKASGKGKVFWRFREDGPWRTFRGEGELRDGKTKIGHWVVFYSDGDRAEGPYVDDKRHGHWVWHSSDGEVGEGPYIDGKLHGRWVERGTRGEEWHCWVRDERKDYGGHAPCASIRMDDRSMQATDGIALRSGPGDDYEEIGRLSADNKVEVTHGGSDWVWVEAASGKQGFVPLSALEEVSQPTVVEVEKPAPAKTEEPDEAKPVETKPEAAAVVTEPKCASGHDSQCWVELTNRSGCFFFLDDKLTRYDEFSLVFLFSPQNITSAHWSGKCVDGVATGAGVMTTSAISSYEDNDEQEVRWSGTLLRGKWDGNCQIRSYRLILSTTYSLEVELSYTGGIPHGSISWTERVTDSNSNSAYNWSIGGNGLFQEGKKHGEWTMHGESPAGGSTTTIIYDNGEIVRYLVN